jgi:hypothetical protein
MSKVGWHRAYSLGPPLRRGGDSATRPDLAIRRLAGPDRGCTGRVNGRPPHQSLRTLRQNRIWKLLGASRLRTSSSPPWQSDAGAGMHPTSVKRLAFLVSCVLK